MAPNSTSDIDLVNLQNQFLNHLKTEGKSENTRKNYRTDLECFNGFLKMHQGKLNISKYDIPQILNYGKFLQEKYTSDNSRRRRVQTLRTFFDFLVAKEIFTHNPVKKIPTSPKFLDIPRPTSMEGLKTVWGHLLTEEENAIEGMPKLVALRNQTIFLSIYGGGLKVSDLANLPSSQISLKKCPRITIIPKKNNPYTIPLHDTFGMVCKKYLSLLKEAKSKSKVEFDHLLFNANPYRILSGGLTPRGLEISMEEMGKKLNMTITPKSLRQSCIFKWLHQDINEAQIKYWMGVSPSYPLTLYKNHMELHYFNDDFLNHHKALKHN